MSVGPRAERTLEVTRRISGVLAQEGIPHALVGSVAMAIHGYVRATRDLDLGVLVPPVPRMTTLAEALRREGFEVEWSPPAPDDELGGVLSVVGDDFDGAISSADIKCPLIGNGTTIRNHATSFDCVGGGDVGSQRKRSLGNTGTVSGRGGGGGGNSKTDRALVDCSGEANDDVEDSL